MTRLKNIRITTMKKRLIALILAVLITATIGYTVAQACAVQSGCPYATVSVYQYSGTTNWTHTYKGGFLNLFTYTCYVKNTWDRYAMVCQNGHIYSIFDQTLTVIHGNCVP